MADPRRSILPRYNKICDECRETAAQSHCGCTGVRVYLCGQCIVKHINKQPGRRHELIPAEHEIASISAYRERSDALNKGKSELEQNLAKIDLCKEELTEAVNLLVWELTLYLRESVSKLDEMKALLSANIVKSVQEAENTLVSDTAQLTEKYSKYLRSYQKDALVLFNYTINPNLVETCLQHMPNFTLIDPGEYRNTVARLKPDQIQVFNLEKETWGSPVRLLNTVQFGKRSVYTHAHLNHIFCCGSTEPRVNSMDYADYLINFVSGSVEELQPLRVARCAPGVLHHAGALFVFGSNSHTDYHSDQNNIRQSSGKEVEMMQLAEHRWSQLPDMPTMRYAFTPCVHGGNVYLCDGMSPSIDVLEVNTRRFLNPLPIPLPKESYHSSVAVVIGDELIVITTNHTTIVSLLRPASVASQKHKEMLKGPASNPVVYQQRIFWVNYDEECMRMRGRQYNTLDIVKG